MREVVTMPAFSALQGLAGSGQGAVQRDALLQELAKRYLPAVVDEVGQLVNGMLDQPAGQTIYGSAPTLRPENLPSTPNQQADYAKALKDIHDKYDEVISELRLISPAPSTGRRPSSQTAESNSFEQENAQDPSSEATKAAGAGRSSDAAYQYIKPQKETDPRSQTDPAYAYITDSRHRSPRVKRNSLRDVVLFTSMAIVIIGGLAYLTSSEQSAIPDKPSANGDQATISQNKDIGDVANMPWVNSADYPRYGPSATFSLDGRNWTFYKHFIDADFYLDLSSIERHGEDHFTILQREISPLGTTDRTLEVNCKDKTYSFDGQESENINMGTDSDNENVVYPVYASNCRG